MFAAFLVGLALVIGLILIGRWFVAADPKQVLKWAGWTGAILLLAATVVLAITGRLAWAIGALWVAVPLILRVLQARRSVKSYARMAGFGGGGRTSSVETAGVRMTLDHDTGVLDGEVIGGPFAGRHLSDLSLEDLLALLAEWRNDVETRQVLEAFLDRSRPDWRQAAGTAGEERGSGGPSDAGSATGSGPMSRAEALAVLGLEEGADEAAIRAAHRRLIRHAHPDQGGSNWLAARINEARRVLLTRGR